MVYLSSEQCKDSGGLYEVGCGWIGKVRCQRSLGAGFDPHAGFSPEDATAQWATINGFSGAAYPADNVDALKEMMANLQKFAG